MTNPHPGSAERGECVILFVQDSIELLRKVKQQGREIIHINLLMAKNQHNTDFSNFLTENGISTEKFKDLLTNRFAFQTFNKGIMQQPQMGFIRSFDKYLDRIVLDTDIIVLQKKE